MDAKTRNTIDLIRNRYAERVEEIRGDRTRTDEYKRATLAREYLTAKGRIDALSAKDKTSQAGRRRTLEAQVFGISGLIGDSGSLAISRRDAGDRAAQLTDERSALDLLARAERSGDEPLARAIAERAVEAGWADVANTFLETRPLLDKALTEIWNYESPSLATEMRDAMEIALAKPHEIDGIPDHQLGQIAESGDNSPALNDPLLADDFAASLNAGRSAT